VASSHIDAFLWAKDHVLALLGSVQNAESGRFREELLRAFLRRLLPSAVAVDTGFVYGFEQVPTSNQMDIIVWDKASHPIVYDAGTMVIVLPEAVIAVVSVKSRMSTKEIRQGLKKLMSVAPPDAAFRSNVKLPSTDRALPAIAKFLVFYSQAASTNNVLPTVASTLSDLFATRIDLAHPLVDALRCVDPIQRDDRY
jgi:hypothetical protein